MSYPKLKLHYFELPGRGETTRIMLNYGGIPFEDALIDYKEQWNDEFKAQFPFKQVPVLEVDGKMLAQSSAIERYVAKLAGLYPTDPWEAAKVDELVAFQQEITDLFMPTYAIADLDARIKARQDIVAGSLKTKFEKLTSLIEAAGSDFFTGSKPTYADFLTYKNLSGFASGAMDGVPKDLLDSYPVLKAFHNRVAALPALAARYEKVTEGPRLAYKVLP